MSAIIENIRKNVMGTMSFDLKAKGMRKAQNFVVYPIDKTDSTIRCQSDKKWIIINPETKTATISKKGNTSWDYNYNGHTDLELDQDTLNTLLDSIRGTASKKAGNNGIMYCDNSQANKI